jgi:probable rRNA maturation factor
LSQPTPPGASRRRRTPDAGTLEVFVADEQAEREVDLARWEALARNVLEHEGVRGDAELSLLFVDEATIAQLNATFMGKTGPTDVLAFPIDAEEELGTGRSPDGGSAGPDREPANDVPVLLGDVVICPLVAARNAPGHAGTYDDEIALLTVHGILHVLGHDHATPEETEVMQARERELLERFHRSPR